MVGTGDCHKIRHAAVRAHRGDGLVLGTTVAGVHRERPLGHLHHPLAADHAAEAGISLLEDGLGHPLAADGLSPLKGATGPVAGGQAALLVLRKDALSGAQQSHPVHVRLLKVVSPPLRQRLHRLWLSQFGAVAPAHGDRLEVLGGHHRAHPGAPVGPVGVVDQCAEADSLLARRAALKDLDTAVIQFLPDGVLHVGGELPPEVGGVPQFRLPVVHPQVDGPLGLAVDHDAVKAAGFELRRPEPPSLRVADESGFG